MPTGEIELYDTHVAFLEHTLEPITGKAVPVCRGEIFRIEQLDGGTCVDFNAFDLHDYTAFAVSVGERLLLPGRLGQREHHGSRHAAGQER